MRCRRSASSPASAGSTSTARVIPPSCQAFPNRALVSSLHGDEESPMKLGTVLVTAATAAACLPAAASAQARGPSVVSLGDSAISGEAGRWAGNTNGASARTDATGPATYYDNADGTAEAIPGCHRSKSAEVHIGGGVRSLNLACSGARTYTHFGGDGAFKPGIDFYSDAGGREGQALALEDYAKTHAVQAVVVLIGANDYGFADIVQTCVTDWLTSPSWWKNYCQDDPNITAMFSSGNINAITLAVRGAFSNVKLAMERAGYAADSYKLLVQTYSSPVPPGSQFRYSESGWTRQSTGGCGMWNRDADWANDTAVVAMNNSARNGAAQSGLTNYRMLELQNLLDGHKLCQNADGLLE